VNVGPNPTFGEDHAKVEAHLAGCHDPIYGRPLEVDFLERLRDVRRFASTEELVEQVKKDVAAAQTIASQFIY
jgi:riboflavin kinase/FMN adenylyltransferase